MGYRLCISVKDPQPTRYEVGVYPTYDDALEAFDKYDKPLRQGRLFQRLADSAAIRRQVKVRPLTSSATPIDKRPHGGVEAYLAVRDEDDPGWAGLNRMALVRVTTPRGAQREDDILKRLGKKMGVHGHTGGWIYSGDPVERIDSYGFAYTSHKGCRLTPYQGWGSWAANRAPSGSVAVGFSDHFIRYWMVEDK